jgi:hypothetical protein
MDQPTTTMRDVIEAAMDQTTQASAPAPEQPQEPAGSLPGGEATPAAELSPADESAPAAESGTQDLNTLAEETQQDNQQRDENGRFKPRDEMTPGPKSGPRQPGERAPASWRPDVREHWAQLPESVRAEVHRREVEVQRTLQESAEARKSFDAVMKTIEPYQAFIKAENSNPLQAIDNLMSTAARLRTGTAPELAQMVAGMVRQFGVGRFGASFIEQLDSALAGQTPQVDPQAAAIEQVLNQRLAPLQSMFQQFEQAKQFQQQQVAESAQNEVAQFLDRAEFGNDVREEMADLLEIAHRRGEKMTLQVAYQKACMLNDRVRQVMQGRQQAQGAQQQTQAAQRARAAAVSVSGSAPMGALRQESTDIRSAIEAAISMTSR